jgi:hypothetical protein
MAVPGLMADTDGDATGGSFNLPGGVVRHAWQFIDSVHGPVQLSLRWREGRMRTCDASIRRAEIATAAFSHSATCPGQRADSFARKQIASMLNIVQNIIHDQRSVEISTDTSTITITMRNRMV